MILKIEGGVSAPLALSPFRRPLEICQLGFFSQIQIHRINPDKKYSLDVSGFLKSHI